MAGSVAERRREFGIRLALGATAGAIQRQVVQRGMLLGAAGVVAGTIAAIAARRTIEARLFGVTPLDPVTFAAAGLTIVTLCAVASLVPAVRAGRVDPVKSLRVD
jgi:putative ABC transport system permease protein